MHFTVIFYSRNKNFYFREAQNMTFNLLFVYKRHFERKTGIRI